MKKNKIILVLLILFASAILINLKLKNTNTLKSYGKTYHDANNSEITLYTLDSVSNMSLVGTNRGNYHDRQDLGIYMDEGASFKIRIKNYDEFKRDLTLDVLNDDSSTEKTYTIKKDGTWQEIDASTQSVPFIRTVYESGVKPVVEIKDKNKTSKLIKYTYNMDEDKFFNDWKESNDKFAVIEGKSLTMLVPVKNINNIVNKNAGPYNFKTIDELLAYYDDFTDMYDKFLGLEYNNKDKLNNNVKTKYFVKANKHGAGAAYYSDNHTAQNGDNISGYLSRGWLNLHEFGHGYQGTIAHQELSLGEVTNNILGYYYQQTFLTGNDKGWMGDKLAIEKNMKNKRDSIKNFNEYNEREKLYVLVNVLDKLGPEKTWAQMNKDYRKLRSEGKTITTSDLFATEFSKSGYNVIPYLNANKIEVSESVASKIYEQDMPIIYYLRDLTNTDLESENIRKDLGLKSNYDLVSSDELKEYNLTGNLKLKFDIDNINLIKGKKAYLMNGKEIVKEFSIDKDVELESVPVGMYYIKLPMSDNVYDHNYETILVKENTQNEKNIKYTKIEDNPLASDDEIDFLGLGNSLFAKINIDMQNKTLNLKANDMEPHSYFTDTYASVKILDNNNKEIYNKDFIGNKSLGSINDNINIDYGYKILIKHREKDRLKFKSKLLDEYEDYLNSETNSDYRTYIITKAGLVKENSENNYNNYKSKVDKYIANVRNSISIDDLKNNYKYFKEKNYIKLMINDLNDEDKVSETNNNKDILEEEKIIIDDNNTPKNIEDDSRKKNENTKNISNNKTYNDSNIEKNKANNIKVPNTMKNNGLLNYLIGIIFVLAGITVLGKTYIKR